MTIRTEDALDALATMLAGVAALPTCARDQTLPGAFAEDGSDVGRWLCLRRGVAERIDNLLSADGGRIYEIDHLARLEWLCEHPDRDTRVAVWRAGLEAIDDALEADRTLAGAVGYAEIAEMDFDDLSTAGIAEIEATVLSIRLTFTSSRPF